MSTALILLIIIIISTYLLYIFYFLRKPPRTIPSGSGIFVSPAHGKIISIIQTDDPHITIDKEHHPALETMVDTMEGPYTIVSIMMTVADVHRQRVPYDGKVIEQRYYPGKFQNVVFGKGKHQATFRNENNQILIQTPEGAKYKVIQIAGLLARKIVSHLKPNQNIKSGDILGLIKLGSQVSIVFDKHFVVSAEVGQKVIDGETVIATLLQ